MQFSLAIKKDFDDFVHIQKEL